MSDIQREQTTALLRVLRKLLEDHERLRASANVKLFHDPARPRRFIRLDVFIAAQDPQGDLIPARGDRAPELVFEMTHTNLHRAATRARFRLYRELRVKEVFLLPPVYKPTWSGLCGYRLQAGGYSPIRVAKTGGEPSRVLGYHLRRTGEGLCFLDPTTGEQVATTGRG